jgi:hypothetical protein
MEPKICIVILNWNGFDETAACLWSLRRVEYGNYEVILVDNGSTDGSPDEIARRFPEVHMIRNEKNVGFDEGNNIGIRASLARGADAVFLLNNDTVVCKRILRNLADASFSLPRAGILGPKIYYFDEPEIVWWAGCRRTRSATGWLLMYTQEGKGEREQGKFDEVKEVDAVVGCAMYIRKEVFADVGLLDARYFIYHEEFDFCYRAKKQGWVSYFVPAARVWHKVSLSLGGQDSPSLYFLWTRNWLLLSRKQTNLALWPLLYYYYVKECLWVYQGLRERGIEKSADAVLAGAWSALLNRFGPIADTRAPRLFRRLAAWDHERKAVSRG